MNERRREENVTRKEEGELKVAERRETTEPIKEENVAWRTRPAGEPKGIYAQTWKPTAGGVLLIVHGLLSVLSGVGITAAGDFLNEVFGMSGFQIAGVPFLVLGLVALVGGIFALMRRVWGLALAGGIAAAIPSPFIILGIPALIFISMSRPEFR